MPGPVRLTECLEAHDLPQPHRARRVLPGRPTDEPDLVRRLGREKGAHEPPDEAERHGHRVDLVKVRVGAGVGVGVGVGVNG